LSRKVVIAQVLGISRLSAMPTTPGNPNASAVATPTANPSPVRFLKDIHVGNISSERSLEMFKGGLFRISDCARGMLQGQFVTFVILPLSEIGFTTPATWGEISSASRAFRFSLGHCQLSDAPEARGTYMDQPDGEVVWIAMEPIVGPDGEEDMFRLTCEEGERWLRGSYPRPPEAFPPETLFLFRHCRRAR
jgi:hypothetical protein